jgi:hypothetical protein
LAWARIALRKAVAMTLVSGKFNSDELRSELRETAVLVDRRLKKFGAGNLPHYAKIMVEFAFNRIGKEEAILEIEKGIFGGKHIYGKMLKDEDQMRQVLDDSTFRIYQESMGAIARLERHGGVHMLSGL